jgi:hypothetical protein
MEGAVSACKAGYAAVYLGSGPIGDCSKRANAPTSLLCRLCLQVSSMCRTWHYERAVSSPANLYKAQLKRRKARAALASR